MAADIRLIERWLPIAEIWDRDADSAIAAPYFSRLAATNCP